jgi:hypothetical protein
MDNVTIKKASELFSKSKRTIQRYISSGKLSYTEQDDGTKLLNVDELGELFGKLSPPVTRDMSQNVTPVDNVLLIEAMNNHTKALNANTQALNINTASNKELVERMAIAPPEPIQDRTSRINSEPVHHNKTTELNDYLDMGSMGFLK